MESAPRLATTIKEQVCRMPSVWCSACWLQCMLQCVCNAVVHVAVWKWCSACYNLTLTCLDAATEEKPLALQYAATYIEKHTATFIATRLALQKRSSSQPLTMQDTTTHYDVHCNTLCDPQHTLQLTLDTAKVLHIVIPQAIQDTPSTTL